MGYRSDEFTYLADTCDYPGSPNITLTCFFLYIWFMKQTRPVTLRQSHHTHLLTHTNLISDTYSDTYSFRLITHLTTRFSLKNYHSILICLTWFPRVCVSVMMQFFTCEIFRSSEYIDRWHTSENITRLRHKVAGHNSCVYLPPVVR